MINKEDLKEIISDCRAKTARKWNRIKENIRDDLTHFKESLTGMDDADNEINDEVIKTWLNHGISFVSGWLIGFIAYGFWRKYHLIWEIETITEGSELVSLSAPPAPLYAGFTMIGLVIFSIFASAAACVLVQVGLYFALNKELKYAVDVRNVGIALTVLIYIVSIIFYIIFNIPVPCIC